jgi:hypothetical protein
MYIPRGLALTISSVSLAAGSVFALGAATQANAATTTTASQTLPTTSVAEQPDPPGGYYCEGASCSGYQQPNGPNNGPAVDLPPGGTWYGGGQR